MFLISNFGFMKLGLDEILCRNLGQNGILKNRKQLTRIVKPKINYNNNK